MRTLLVTGASGFVGRHFIASAVQRGYDITATGRGYAPEWLPSAENWISSDISTADGLADVAHEYWGVAHFANISKPSDYSDETHVSKSLEMVANLSNHISSARFLFPSSCHVYKASGELKDEDSETVPAGLYGRAKLGAERFLLALKHIDVRIARPFNHIGPYMPHGLMVPSLAERVRTAKAGEPIIMHGRNSVRRPPASGPRARDRTGHPPAHRAPTTRSADAATAPAPHRAAAATRSASACGRTETAR